MEQEQIQLFQIIRGQSRALITARDEATLLKKVPGLANNMLWIFGHLVRTTDFLILKLSGHAMNFPADLDAYFAKGSSPQDWKTSDGLKERLLAAEELCQAKILDFLAAAEVRPYAEPYITSSGFVLSNVKESLRYNVVHEGIHLGQLQLYSKLVG
jgi:hypothetical protein